MRKWTNKPNSEQKYPVHNIRMADRTWEDFKRKKALSGKSWNLFLTELLDSRKVIHSSDQKPID